MRFVGAALIAAAFAALGVSESLRLRRRARLVSALCSGLELLRGEIVSRLAPMPEAAERLARYGPEPARGFYAAVCAGLENLGGAEFSEIWRRALGLLDLPDPARAAMENLGGSLGRYGAAEQAAAISACEQELRREAERARELSGLSPALFTPVVKCVGIGIVCALGSEACKDAGSGQLASAVELAGAAAALVCALPLVSALLDTVEGIV